MELQTRERLSRFNDSPALDARGNPIAIQLTARDLTIFSLLARYRYLRSNVLHALVGGNYAALKHRLKLLCRKPNAYLHKPPSQFNYFNAHCRHLIHELTERAEKELRRRGVAVPSDRLGDERLFAHSMMINDTLASLELGGRPGRIVWWDEIARHPQFPSDAPRKLRVKIRKLYPTSGNVHHAEFDYTNDSHGVFAIDDSGPYQFFSLEAEHSNRVDCGNLHQVSFLKKFLAISHIMEHELYKRHWGLPNLRHLVVAPSQARIDTMKKLILRETENKGASYVLFREIPVMDDLDPQFRPMPELYTGLWQRAGYPEITLAERR